MSNKVCSPELSYSTDESEDKSPHAYVAYLNGEKETVPVSFIMNFPSSWQQKNHKSGLGWDLNYLFKVFWSSDDSDTPQKLLQRLPEIPTFEPGEAGTEEGKAGYYRASVLLVGETLEDVQKKIDLKRVTPPMLRNTYSSFDGSDKPVQKPALQPSKKTNQSSVKGKKGINKDAVVENTSPDLRSFLQSMVNTSKSCSESLVEPETVKPTNSGGEAQSKKRKSSNSKKKEDTALSSKQKQQVSDKNVKANKNQRNSSELMGQCRSEKKSLSVVNLHQNVKEPYHEPSKSVRKCVSQEIMLDGEPKTNELLVSSESVKSDDKRSTRKIKYSHEVSSSSSESEMEIRGKRFKVDPDFTPQKYEDLKSEIIIKDSTIKRLRGFNERFQADNAKAHDKIMELEYENLQLKKKLNLLQISKVNIGGGVASTCTESARIKEEECNLDNVDLCKTEIHVKDEFEHKINPEFELKNKSALELKEIFPNAPIAQEEFESVWEVINGIGSAAKKDLRFIKNLAITAFGPEVLASHSIKGTKRGPKGKVDDPKPALDQDILAKIKKCLVTRVGEDNERSSKNRFHEAI